jgi:hypothetical protein
MCLKHFGVLNSTVTKFAFRVPEPLYQMTLDMPRNPPLILLIPFELPSPPSRSDTKPANHSSFAFLNLAKQPFDLLDHAAVSFD